jgi:hypothetical protein
MRLASTGNRGIGNAYLKQGKFDDALTAYRESVAISKALVAKNSSNSEWQGDLSAATDAIGLLAGRPRSKQN